MRIPKIPKRWTTARVIKYYFQVDLLCFSREHQRRATLQECRQMYRAAKELCIKYDRRYSGVLRA